MRFRTLSVSGVLTLTLVTAGAIVGASPTPIHNHHRLHAVRRTGEVTKVVETQGPTVVAFVLNGKIVDQNQVCKGIHDGNLQWEDPTNGPSECSSSSTEAIAKPTATTMATEITSSTPSVAVQGTDNVKAMLVQSSQASESLTKPVPSIPAHLSTADSVPTTSAPSSDPAPIVTSSTATPSYVETFSSQARKISEGQGLELEFPDGTIDCSNFPSKYGPIEVEWANLGGWAGIQYVTVEGDSVGHIVTAVPGGKGCIPGAMCSYACPPGYQKSQWPSTQGSTGQSVGGIQCNSAGKLSLTNPSLSKTLCMKGTGATNVQNKLSTNAAICRTDYPGTENEIVPLNTQPESTNPLTCPDANNYFQWDGLPTSAQYYINNQGIAVEDACMWGTDGSDMGNWAPSFLGVGQDIYGKTWLSISSTAQNNPSSYSPLNYTVTIQGNTSGNCRVSNGKYCSGDNFDDCNDQGCTVELMSGQGTYLLSD
ncbi:MAG: hypothetical protein Q9175_004198 [Cornicularia normoerica]